MSLKRKAGAGLAARLFLAAGLAAAPTARAGPPLEPMVGQPMPPQVVINSPNTPWRQGGAINKALGAACAAHEFNERVPMRYRAFFKDGVLGVAFGHGRNLVDPRGQADRRMIYLFLRADSTACIVIEVPNTDPNALQQNPQ